MRDADVIIVGGGIIGCSVAWQLSKLGKQVLVLERTDVASGSAGATDGVVGYHTKKPGQQMDLAVQSIEMFRTLNEQLGEDVEYGFEAGGMQPVEDKMQWDILSEIVEQQRKSGVDIRMISKDEARKIEPQLADDIYGALYSPTGGKVNPLKLTMAYARAASGREDSDKHQRHRFPHRGRHGQGRADRQGRVSRRCDCQRLRLVGWQGGKACRSGSAD